VEALHDGAQHREGRGRGDAVAPGRAGSASGRPTGNVALLSSNLPIARTAAFLLESSTMEGRGACARLATEFFYKLVMRTRDILLVVGGNAKPSRTRQKSPAEESC